MIVFDGAVNAIIVIGIAVGLVELVRCSRLSSSRARRLR